MRTEYLTTGPDPLPFNAAEIRSAFALADTMQNGARCVRRKVGAVLVRPSGGIVGLGFNHLTGEAASQPSCIGTCPRALKTHVEAPPFEGYQDLETACYAVHVEMDAINNYVGGANSTDLQGFYIFITCKPCPQCAKVLEDAGVFAVWEA